MRLFDEESVKPLGDVSLQSDHRCWGLVCRGMEITTVTAGVAGCKLWDLAECEPVFFLGYNLPRILTTVSEEDVRALIVPATLVGPSWESSCLLMTFQTAKHSIAHLGPVSVVKKFRAHGMQLTWRLEEAILRAVLVGPLTSWSVDINCGVCQKTCIIVSWLHSDLISVLNHCIEDCGVILSLQRFKHVAQSGSITILHACDKDVSIIEHKVIPSDRLCCSVCNNWINQIRLASISE